MRRWKYRHLHGGCLKHLLLLFVTISSIGNASACPNFSGLYSGTCKIVFNGQESQRALPIGFVQQDCDKFTFNDLTPNPMFYTLDKSTLYEQPEKKYLRRASVFDNGKTVYLRETLVRESPKYGNALQAGTAIFKKIDDDTVTYEGERFDLLKNEVTVTTSCAELKRQQN